MHTESPQARLKRRDGFVRLAAIDRGTVFPCVYKLLIYIIMGK